VGEVEKTAGLVTIVTELVFLTSLVDFNNICMLEFFYKNMKY
jgi:hypothetical protein